MSHDGREFIGAHSLAGPILVLDASEGVALGECVELEDPDGGYRAGTVLRITAASPACTPHAIFTDVT